MRKVFSSFLLVVTILALLLPPHLLFAGTDTIVETNSSRRSAVPRFTLEQAILTALRQNPSIQIARQEIERTKGLYIQMRAEILPQVNMTGDLFGHRSPLASNHGGPTEVAGTPTPAERHSCRRKFDDHQ